MIFIQAIKTPVQIQRHKYLLLYIVLCYPNALFLITLFKQCFLLEIHLYV